MQVREKIALALKEKCNTIGPSNFEFAKVTPKKISVLHLSKLIEYNCDGMKKLVVHGLLYIRMKVGFEFVLCENNTSDSDSERVKSGALKIINILSTFNGTFCIVSGTPDGTSAIVPSTSNDNSGVVPSTSSGTSDIFPHTSNSNSIIVPGTSNGNSGIDPHRQEEEQKIESPHEFFRRVVSEFPLDILEPT